MLTTHRIQPLRSAAFALLATLLLVLPGCSGEDGAGHITHYYHPVWSSDGKHVVAAIADYMTDELPSATPNVAFRTLPSGAQAVFSRLGFGAEKRYWIAPNNAYVAAVDDKVYFWTMNGGGLGTYTMGTPIAAIAFIDSLGSFLWAGGRSGSMVIGLVQSAGAPWAPAQETIIKDSASSEPVLDIVTTSRTTFAVRRGAEILEYNMSGSLLGRYALAPRVFASPWQSRIHYADAFGRYLFALDDSGIVSIDLDRRARRIVTYGTVINFDVNSPSGNMVYETTSGDIWLANTDGTPMARLAPHSVMPALSPDGKTLVAVARINADSDSLIFRKWIQ